MFNVFQFKTNKNLKYTQRITQQMVVVSCHSRQLGGVRKGG